MPEEHRGFWVLMEAERGALAPSGFELLGKGRELADALGEPLTAVILGLGIDHLAKEAIRYGADVVYLAEHQLLEFYSTDASAKTMIDLVKRERPNILLVASTPNGRDLAGRLAVDLQTGLTANAVKLEVDVAKRLLLGGVPGFGGAVVAMIKCETGRPQMCTVRPGVFSPAKPDEHRRGRVEAVPVELVPKDLRVHTIERKILSREDISGSERVVVAGLGVGGDLSLAQEVAGHLGAALGVTRPLVDAGLALREKQVGSTGVALRGKLAVVLGASGASHFTSGLKDVDLVVAVNKDPHAEIFEHADLCVVADLNEFLPLLIEELEKLKVVVR